MHDDLPPDLPRLDVLETYLVLQLARVREKKADLERQAREQRSRSVERVRPPAPDWMIEEGLARGAPVYVHRGDCHMKGKRSRAVLREQALRALAEGVDACTHCRPDTDLGILE